jgi:transcriptional regulator with XRE-family HTH domain
MPKKKIVLLPNTGRILDQLGENIKLARLRRNLSAELIAQRADISRPTLTAIEQGSPAVSIGSYLLVLQALGLEKDFLIIARDDELGRKLQDAQLTFKRRATKRSSDEKN